ncbi:MAG TPA: cation:proton antiporter [Candidatus Polarisedimenticolaceae bacterium]
MLADLTLCVAAAWLLAAAASSLRQPLLLAYLAAGFALGAEGFGLIRHPESVEAVAELGLIFLLFMIGLEIDLKKVLEAGRTIAIAAGIQIGAGVLLGVGLFRLLGHPLGAGGWDALYLGVAGALSSTVVIVKVLYDKGELDTLPGRITLGILVLQDLAAILFLAVQPSLGSFSIGVIPASLGRASLLLAATFLVSRFVLPFVFRRVARVPELVVVGAIAWCLAVGELAEFLHLSREMGALVAGIALSTFPYALDVGTKVTTLRDFFVTLFFVGLGMRIPWPDAGAVGAAAGLAAFVVASRLATVFPVLHAMRQGLRASLLPALNLSQVSEFSLVIVALGVGAGHVSPALSGTVSLAFVGLAVASTFAMVRSGRIVRRVIPWMKRAGWRDLGDAPEAAAPHPAEGRIVLLGFFRTASSILDDLARERPERLRDVLVVDFNPEVHAELKRRGVRAVYGDLAQPDTLRHAGVAPDAIVISSIPDSLLKGTSNERIVRALRARYPGVTLVARGERLSDVEALIAAGADDVILPRLDEARDLLETVDAALGGTLASRREARRNRARDRGEVLP